MGGDKEGRNLGGDKEGRNMDGEAKGPSCAAIDDGFTKLINVNFKDVEIRLYDGHSFTKVKGGKFKI